MKKLLLSILALLTLLTTRGAEEQGCSPQSRLSARSLAIALATADRATAEGLPTKRKLFLTELQEKTRKKVALEEKADELKTFRIQCRDGIFVENVAQETVHLFITFKDLLTDVETDTTNLIPLHNYAYDDCIIIIEYTNQHPEDRSAFLSKLSHEKKVSLITLANFLNLDNSTNLYTDLMEHVLSTFTPKQLQQLENGTSTLLDPAAVAYALKRMQLTALSNWSTEMHSLEHLCNLGKEKVEWLKKVNLYSYEISIEDLKNNEATHRLLATQNDCGLVTLKLHACFLSSLKGLADLLYKEPLEALELDSNSIASLDPADFAPLTSLIRLSVKNNRIGTVTAQLFTQLPALEEIDLDDNPLTDFNVPAENIPATLKMIRLCNTQLSQDKKAALVTTVAQNCLLFLS